MFFFEKSAPNSEREAKKISVITPVPVTYVLAPAVCANLKGRACITVPFASVTADGGCVHPATTGAGGGGALSVHPVNPIITATAAAALPMSIIFPGDHELD